MFKQLSFLNSKDANQTIGIGWAFGSLGFNVVVSMFIGAFFVAAKKTLDLTIDDLLLITIIGAVLTLAASRLLTKLIKVNWVEVAALKMPDKTVSQLIKAIGLSIAAYLTILITAGFIIEYFNLSPSEQDIAIDIREGNASAVIAFLTVVISAPIFEEIINRGFIFRSLDKAMPFWLAALISSFIFGLLHVQPLAMLMTFFLGFILCGLTKYCGSIYPAIGLHLLNNLFTFVALLST